MRVPAESRVQPRVRVRVASSTCPKALAMPYLLRTTGAVAQLGERLLCKQEVTGSIPVGSIPSRPCSA